MVKVDSYYSGKLLLFRCENISRRILNDDVILGLLGDGRNSELSDFSDNDYQTQEFDTFLENYNNSNYDDIQ